MYDFWKGKFANILKRANRRTYWVRLTFSRSFWGQSGHLSEKIAFGSETDWNLALGDTSETPGYVWVCSGPYSVGGNSVHLSQINQIWCNI